MIRFSKLWIVIFGIVLFIPGYASGTATFTFDHPAFVALGETFEVKVYLEADGNIPPVNVHAYPYCFNYDQTLLELVPLQVNCTDSPTDPSCATDPPTCIAVPPIDGGFFSNVSPYPGYRDCSDNCTQAGYPTAQNCCNSCLPQCDQANVLFFDLAGYNPGEPAECVCEAVAPFSPKLVSTLTFKAIAAGTAEFSTNPECTWVSDCEGNSSPPVVIVPPIVIYPKPSVPAFSGYGIGIFALLIAISFILITRKLRRNRRNTSVILVLLALGIALGLGMVFSGVAAAAQSCPEDCKHYNLDLNGDKLINVADLSLLVKCTKSSCASTNPAMDFDGNGVVDQTDHQILLGCMKRGCFKVE